MRFKQHSPIAASASLVSLLVGAALLAPTEANANPVPANSYAAKVVCERETTSNVETKVNIHNPGYGNVSFFWKAVESEPVGSTDGVDIVVHQAYLGPDGAAFIECDTEGVRSGDEFEGFIVVISTKALDVVSVLDAESGDEVPADFEIDRVSATKVSVPLAVWNSWPTPIGPPGP